MRMNILNRKDSRTTNTVINFASGILGLLISILMQFVVRTVFIHTLGKSYLGINGLFTNVLTMLSLAELGFGSAILYKLYAPLASGDEHKITLLMYFYKKVYRVVGVIILGLGICLIPLLPYIIRDYDKLIELGIPTILIFVLYLLKTSSTYFFFAYKSAIIRADQKEYVISFVTYICIILMSVTQIIALIVYPNFEVYVIISIIEVIIQNFICARIADRMYPYINEKCPDVLPLAERKGIFKDCYALLILQINGVVLKATDNIVLSIFLGIEMVGYYSNYYVLYTTVTALFSRVFESAAHSIGNLHTTKDKKHEYDVYKAVVFVTAILGSTAGVGIAACSDELVSIWIGSSWIIPQPFAILMGIETFTLALRLSLSSYRSSLGLFQQMKYRPVASMIINLVLSVILVNVWGICGVLVGTIVADWTTTMWFDPLVIHKYGFGKKSLVKSYYARVMKYLIVTLAVGFGNYMFCKKILVGYGILSFLVHALVCGITVPCVMMAISANTTEGKYVKEILKRCLRKTSRKKRIKT